MCILRYEPQELHPSSQDIEHTRTQEGEGALTTLGAVLLCILAGTTAPLINNLVSAI
jgi:hypothetical protein